jgi:hypothetical protein
MGNVPLERGHFDFEHDTRDVGYVPLATSDIEITHRRVAYVHDAFADVERASRHPSSNSILGHLRGEQGAPTVKAPGIE